MSEIGRPGEPGAEPSAPAAPATDRDEALRLARRRFFREMASDAVRTAATLAGVAGALRETTQEMADSVMADTSTARPPGAVPARPAAPAVTPPAGFRSPFRLEADRLILVDQRRLPDELVEVDLQIGRRRRPGDPRDGHPGRSCARPGRGGRAGARGGPGPAQQAVRPPGILRGSANALVNARPTAISVRWATNRMLARYAALGELLDDGPAVAAALREEAEAIIGEATLDHAAMARLGAELLPMPEGRPLRLLTHCNTGPLAGPGGTALGVVGALAADGRDIHVYVDETRPWLQGARLPRGSSARPGSRTRSSPIRPPAGSLRGRRRRRLVGADRIAATATRRTRSARTRCRPRGAPRCPVHVVAPPATLDGEAEAVRASRSRSARRPR